MSAGQTHAYLLSDLQAGDRLAVSMQATSGNLDPSIGIVDTQLPLEEFGPSYRAAIQATLAAEGGGAAAIEAVRNQYSLAWDDDSGDGYAAALAFVVPSSGDYVLIAGSSLSVLGRTTSGDYTLRLGLNLPDGATVSAMSEPVGVPIAERIAFPWGASASVEETSGRLTAAAPVASLPLVDIDSGQTLMAYAEAISGNLIPRLILRDFGGKPLEAGNLSGQETQAALQFDVTERGAGYALEVQAGALPDGTVTEGDFRLLVGLNAPEVLTGQAQPQGNKLMEAPIEVQTGLKILRISEVDSPNENFTVLASCA